MCKYRVLTVLLLLVIVWAIGANQAGPASAGTETGMGSQMTRSIPAAAALLPVANVRAGSTPFVYLAYTPDQLIVFNPTADQSMPLAQTTIYNHNPNVTVPGASLVLGDPALFQTPPPVADITQLAPGQCLLFTHTSPTGAALPQDCTVIAQLAINPSLIFWAAPFEVGSSTDGRRHTCPAAVADAITVCIMPR